MARTKSAEPNKKQMGVALPDDLRKQLEQAAQAAGHSIAEEIRRRVERTFEEDAVDPETRGLLAAIKRFSDLVQIQTGYAWHSNPGALAVLRTAIHARFGRIGKNKIKSFNYSNVVTLGSVVFKREELPKVLIVDTLDARTIGRELENLVFHQSPKDTP